MPKMKYKSKGMSKVAKIKKTMGISGKRYGKAVSGYNKTKSKKKTSYK